MPVIPLPDGVYGTIHEILNTDGYIAWRVGTGENVELLYIKSEMPGGGSRLLTAMVDALRINPPYCTVFGFTRCCNDVAHAFYRKWGFALSRVKGVYSDGEAIVFSTKYTDLLEVITRHRQAPGI